MKKVLMAILMAIVLVLSVSLVSAAVTVTSTYGDDTPTFGSDSQQASNPNADEAVDEDIFDNGDITLNNDAGTDATITSITVSAASGFSEDDINVTLDDSDLVVGANSSEAVTLKARIPEQLNAVDVDGDAMAFKVGTVTFNFASASSVSFDVYMQRENKLEIKKVYVTSEENVEEKIEDSDAVKDLKPGENVDVEIRVENIYDDNDDDVEIEDVEAVIEIDDGDMDVDEDISFSDLKGDEDGTETLTFEIEDDVDEDNYNGILYVTGDDEHGARHGEKWELEWDVERQSYEFLFKTASVSPALVECGGTISLTAKIENRGKKDDDEVYLFVESASLGIDLSKEEFEIESTDTYTKTFNAVIPSDTKAGTYNIRFSVYYSGDEEDGVLGDLKDTEFVVVACEDEEDDIVIEDDDVITPPPVMDDDDDVVETSETSFFDTTSYTVILVVAVVIAFIAAILLIVFLILRP